MTVFRSHIILYFFLTLVYTLYACRHEAIEPEIVVPVVEKTYSYLALGDSYTIGEGVPTANTFPALLDQKLSASAYIKLKDTKVIAKTGWTCQALMKSIEDAKIEANSYRLVTLLIGVNDQYRGYPISEYPARFSALLEMAISIAGDKDRVVVLSIPDYSVTPFGQSSGRVDKIAEELKAYNAINKEITQNQGVKYVDITPISQKAKFDLSLLASDKLHPSEVMYREWVDLMYPNVVKALEK